MPGSNILHIAAVRIRVVGVGNLDLQFRGYNDIITEDLAAVPMAVTNAREANVLSNFQSQASRLKGSTDAINEVIRINKITIFAGALWTDYPG